MVSYYAKPAWAGRPSKLFVLNEDEASLDIDAIWDQERQRCVVRLDGELKHLVASINDLAESWLLDKTSPFDLAGRGRASDS